MIMITQCIVFIMILFFNFSDYDDNKKVVSEVLAEEQKKLESVAMDIHK